MQSRLNNRAAVAYSPEAVNCGGGGRDSSIGSNSAAERRKTRRLMRAWEELPFVSVVAGNAASGIPSSIPRDLADFCVWGSFAQPGEQNTMTARLEGFGASVEHWISNKESPPTQDRAAMAALVGKLLSLAQATALSPRPMDEEGEIRLPDDGKVAYRLLVIPIPCENEVTSWVGIGDWTDTPQTAEAA